MKITDILNEATRQCGQDIIERMADERVRSLKELSFDDPQVLMPGIAA